MNKKELVSAIATSTELSKTDVTKVLESLSEVCFSELKANGAFIINDLVRIRMVDKPALPERQMKSPATGKMVTVGARPASKKLKVSAAKQLRDLVKKPV